MLAQQPQPQPLTPLHQQHHEELFTTLSGTITANDPPAPPLIKETLKSTSSDARAHLAAGLQTRVEIACRVAGKALTALEEVMTR